MYRPGLGHALLLGAALAFCTPAFSEPASDEPASPEPPASTQPASAPPRAGLAERSQEQELILQRRLPASEQRQLQAGKETFLALWLPALSETPNGTLILLPGYGEHADHPAMAGPLRHKVPESGWSSLSISLPDAPTPGVQREHETAPAAGSGEPQSTEADVTAAPAGDPAETGDTPAAEQAPRVPVEQAQMEPPAPGEDAANQAPAEQQEQSEQLEQAHAERIFARLDAALAFVEAEQPGPIVLAGDGTGAYWALRYAAQRKPSALQRLALISLRSPTERTLATEPGDLPNIPIADFFYRNRHDEQRAARQRLQASQRLKQRDYRQIALFAVPADPEAEREQLFRRLRGWLSPLKD